MRRHARQFHPSYKSTGHGRYLLPRLLTGEAVPEVPQKNWTRQAASGMSA